MMKVILQEDVPHLGVVGDLVTVKDGFGRNFLIPQGKAVLASPRSIKELDHQKRLAQHRRTLAKARAATDKEKIEALSVVISAKVAPPPLNEMDQPIAEVLQKLFGSVTNRDLAAVLRQAEINVDHRRISLDEPVRTVGKFSSAVRLDGGVTATLRFWVIPEGAADIDSEKKRVEAAQDAMKKQLEAAAQAAAAQARAAALAAQQAAAAKAEAAAAASSEGEAPSEAKEESEG